MHDGDTLSIGDDRTLTFIDTPGHAKHHFSILDSKTNGVFVGDTVGVFYPQLDFDLFLPSTSPNQFDPDAMMQSAEKISSFYPDAIYFGHYGMSENPSEVMKQLKFWLPMFIQTTKNLVQHTAERTFDERSVLLGEELLNVVKNELAKRGVPDDHHVYHYITVDLKVCAMGLLDYYRKKIEKPA